MLASTEERMHEIEEEIRRTPYNKATQKHLGRLRAKLAKLREDVARPKGPRREGPGLRKAGDATVAIAGYPSVGKSTLLNLITEAASQVGDYDFTTLRAVPGILAHRGARIQLLDLPGLTEGAAQGRGRGREVLSQARIADLALLMVDVERPDPEPLWRELHDGGLRLNEAHPRVTVHRTDRGGLKVIFSVPQTGLDEDTVRAVAREWGLLNGEVVVQEDLTLQRLVDHFAGNRVYVPALLVLNKIDLIEETTLARIQEDLRGWTVIPISAREESGVESLIETIYGRLSFIRVYLKPRGQRDVSEEPVILQSGATVEDVCGLLHGGFVERFRYAEVRGPSARFRDQRVGMEHTLLDGDVLSIVTRPG
ncbi:MAG: GTPase [Thermoplasmata archaeon]